MKSKLFIFEDDADAIRMYQLAFKEKYDLTICSTFSNAVYTLENTSGFHAYILDVYDPKSRFNGTDLISLIQSNNIIFVTAFDMAFQMTEKYKNYAYMRKPVFSYKALMQLIDSVIIKKY
jgi:DNA-binding NtrC family response regulator